jgi:hypothetical protein
MWGLKMSDAKISDLKSWFKKHSKDEKAMLPTKIGEKIDLEVKKQLLRRYQKANEGIMSPFVESRISDALKSADFKDDAPPKNMGPIETKKDHDAAVSHVGNVNIGAIQRHFGMKSIKQVRLMTKEDKKNKSEASGRFVPSYSDVKVRYCEGFVIVYDPSNAAASKKINDSFPLKK